MENLPSPLFLLAGLLGLSLIPFIAVMVSSFVKISVVILLLRNALGVQQIPPNMAVNGLAIILSLYIMAPIGYDIHETLSAPDVNLQDIQNPITQQALVASLEPIKAFLLKHSDLTHREFFVRTTQTLWPPRHARNVDAEHLFVLLPAYTVSELTKAFQIGFLLYLPFVVVDLIISNILLAMGMMMVSPMTISLPFKLLLFVLVDGWTRLIQGLVLSYQ